MEGEQSTSSTNEDEQHNKALEFKNSGNDKFSKYNYKGAIIDYKKGLLHEPENSDLHANLAAAYIHLEKYLDAEEHAIYTIHLKPTFYKGYMRAAKAAHGKGMTTLALRRLESGLSLVTDQNGIKELNRLKKQYTAYLSLPSNAEREIDFSPGHYFVSEDEDDVSYNAEEMEKDFSQMVASLNPPVEGASLCWCKEEESSKQNFDLSSSESKKSKKEVPYVLCGNISDKDTRKADKQPNKSNKSARGENLPETVRQTSVENHIPLDKKEEKQPDRPFSEILKDLTKNPDLSKHIQEFNGYLKTASEALLNDNYRKAADNYKAAKERVGLKLNDYGIDDRQFHVIKYAHCVSLINLGSYDDIVKAIQMLSDMETYKYSIPAIYLQLARAFWKLNRFKTALEPLEKLEDMLDNYVIFPTFTWPGSTETIQETTVTGLKEAIKEVNQVCRMPHKPTATCRYDHCLKTSTHILPSESIFISDPDFVGFVRMLCEEKCHIEFHTACWKSYKETMSGLNIGIGKINDKDFLGHRCLTMDCVNSGGNPSQITVIEIIDADGQVKSVNKLDPKTNVDSKKSKKKKCKLDDREKAVKPKKIKEKKVREVKKPVIVVEEEEEEYEEGEEGLGEELLGEGEEDEEEEELDMVQALMALREEAESKNPSLALEEQRLLDVDRWDPRLPFYGRSEEMEKWVEKCENESSSVLYKNYKGDESVDVKDAKEFIFSYFMEILKVEGPLKQEDVEELWKQVADDFCNIKVVLPNLQSMCALLVESTCFCHLEDYICLASQLETAFETVKSEVVETVNFLMDERANAIKNYVQPNLPDLLDHSKTRTISEYEYETSSEDESSESDEEYNSNSSDTEDSEEETSEEVNQHLPVEEIEVKTDTPAKDEFVAVEESDREKFSLQEMLDVMSRVKNMFIKTTSSDESTKVDKCDVQSSSQEVVESPSSDTFETAVESSQNLSGTDNNLSDSFTEEHKTSSNEQNVIVENVETTKSDTQNEATSTVNVIEDDKDTPSEAESIAANEMSDNMGCNKASQSQVETEERQMQTVPVETKDTLSQTKESDLYKEIEKCEELTKQLNVLKKENAKLAKEVIDKENLNKEIKQAQNKAVAHLQEENAKATMKYQEYIKKMEEDFKKQETVFKKKEDKLVNELMKLKDIYVNLVTENQKLSKEVNSLIKQKKDLEISQKSLEKNLKEKVINSQKALLLVIKNSWENQVGLLGKRCVEKITEMHNWLSMVPSGEVEELPSWSYVRQITLEWGDISGRIQQIQADFQTKYSELDSKLSQGEELEDINSLSLPTLPEEPNPLPLDKIHKEITEKYTKRIGELTQLVANQQLEIEKSKGANQQKLMNPFQISQRMQTPLTTAFGSLALQYPYPQNLPSQFGTAPISAPPPSQDVSSVGSSKLLKSDVQTLLKESTGAKFFPPENMSVQNTGLPTLGNTAFPTFQQITSMPPPPVVKPPPPSVGLTSNLLKASSTLTDKKKTVEQPAPLNQEANKAGTSRESTPTPTPEKSKKKKKTKVESTVEATTVAPGSEASSVNEETDANEWSVIRSKNKMAKQPSTQGPTTVSDSKMKNKKKLLDKLQHKFPNSHLKDLDEIVKLVREKNNGSLSGLPFEEIEARVERILMKKQIQKSSTMGLDKFTEAAWGPVKQQETITWANLQLEECTICLEPMGNDRTKVDCNHEFHTKCLRKWLKEKSVCPLCNKFTTMPDEFPAL